MCEKKLTVLIDSWAWIEYIKSSKAGEKVKQILEEEQDILTSSINLAEVYRKLLADMPRESHQLCQKIMKCAIIIPVSSEIALHAAKIKHEKKMGMADAIVAATAEKEHAQILTGDPDFKDFANVIFLKRE